MSSVPERPANERDEAGGVESRTRRASLGDVIDLGSPDGTRLALALAAVLRSLPETLEPPCAGGEGER